MDAVLACSAAPLAGHLIALTGDRRADEQLALLTGSGLPHTIPPG